jgi:uncharacterized metal-binding protein YceD (DUF177 family)
MLNRFRIRIDGCVGEEPVFLEEILAPSLVDLPEGDECSVLSPIQVRGNIYKTDDWVILEAEVDTSIQMPCSTCNEPFEYSIHIDSWKVQENISSIKEGFWDLTEQLREAIVLEFPFLAVCGNGSCTNVDRIRPYLKSDVKKDSAIVTHRPFEKLLQGLEGI